jgi:hypothetical protein
LIQVAVLIVIVAVIVFIYYYKRPTYIINYGPYKVGSSTPKNIPIYFYDVDAENPDVKYFMMSPNGKSILAINEKEQKLLILTDGNITWSQSFQTTAPGPYFLMLFTIGSLMVVNAELGISCVTSCSGWPNSGIDNSPIWLILADDGTLKLTHDTKELIITS